MVTIRIGMGIPNAIYMQFNLCIFQIALAIFARSPAAYEALKSFEILQLPSRSTLQPYTGTFLHEPGASGQCIADQVAQYIVFKAECEKEGKKIVVVEIVNLIVLTRETQASR